MISDDRLKQLIAFASVLVEANKQGVYEVPLMAVPAEALDVLQELVAHRVAKMEIPPDAA